MFKLCKLLLVALLLVRCSKKDDKAGEYNLVISTANGDEKYLVEEAQTMEELQKGLMFRDSLKADSGMIFDLSQVDSAAMWMKNTKIPLDMVFADADGNISWIYENATPMSEDFIVPPVKPTVVIELNGGDVAKNGIKVGDIVRHHFLKNLVNEKKVELPNNEVKKEEAIVEE